MNAILSFTKKLHAKYIFERRAHILSSALADIIPKGASILDVGCGNGNIDRLIMQAKPSISIRGIEILKRPDCVIDCKKFNGRTIPYDDSSCDMCMFIDVLHHTNYLEELLTEAQRVSRKFVLIKDHLCENRLDFLILKIMDWIGNRAYGVNLIYKYQNKDQWEEYFSTTGLEIKEWREKIPLYVFPLNLLFGRKLHFVALLEKVGQPNRPK